MATTPKMLTWPPDPIDERPVLHHPVWDEGGWLHYDQASDTENVRPLPPELAIRELVGFDPQSDAETVSFLREHGSIYRDFQKPHPSMEFKPTGPPPDGTSVHVSDARAHLAIAQACARHALRLNQGDQVATDIWRDVGISLDTDDHVRAENLLTTSLNLGLRAYQPRIETHRTWAFPGKSFGAASAEGSHQISVEGAPLPDLYEGICLQLFNFLVEGLPVTQCASDQCETWFVRQRGRSEHGQNRTKGVKYCSKRCARSHSQRVHRSRLRTSAQDAAK